MKFSGKVHKIKLLVSTPMIRTPVNVHDLKYMHSPYICALSPNAAENIVRTDASALAAEVVKNGRIKRKYLALPYMLLRLL